MTPKESGVRRRKKSSHPKSTEKEKKIAGSDLVQATHKPINSSKNESLFD